MSPKLNISLTLFVIPCKILGKFCDLLNDFSFKFQPSMTIFDYKIVKMQNIPKQKEDELQVSCIDNTYNLIHIRSVIRKVAIVT